MLKLHQLSFLKVVENKKFNNQIPYYYIEDQSPTMGTCHLKNAWVGGDGWSRLELTELEVCICSTIYHKSQDTT